MALHAHQQPPLQRALFEEPPPDSPKQKQPAYGSLWAALHLPQLSLEVVTSEEPNAPRIVTEPQGGQLRVCALSAAAYEFGVCAGMRVTEAYALCPELLVVPRDHAAEQHALRQVAEWAGRYTSMVSLEPEGLLLELEGSLKLFGGLEKLLEKLRSDGAALGHVVIMALAPTPQAALLLARCGQQKVMQDLEALRAELGTLPITALPLSDKQAALAIRLGLRTLRDLWRLPSDGLAKRFGVAFSDYLDRLLGCRPEPRLAYESAPTFTSRWRFPMETDNLTFISHALEKLIARLVCFMRLRGLSLNQLDVIFYHSQQPLSRMELRSQQLCHEAGHLLMLLHERLERQQLPAPVMELELVVNEFHELVSETRSMFSDGVQQGDGDPQWQQFLDKLHSRLGDHAVTGLQLLDEHRPERAWSYGTALAGETSQPRPAWLLSTSQRLANSLKDIQLLSGPERIESGWWDGFDIRRDYYHAIDGRGRRLWMYRDLNDGRWYLHGLFA